jgi:hypothetical protein
VRPHEALGLAVPASRYQASPIGFPEVLPAPEYDTTDQVRRASRDGAIRFHGRRIKLSQAFAGLDVALRAGATDGVWRAYFMRFPIAEVDLRGDEPRITAIRRRTSDAERECSGPAK